MCPTRAQVIRCLQDHSDEEAFSSECKEEVSRDQIRSNQDYRRHTPCCRAFPWQASDAFACHMHALLHHASTWCVKPQNTQGRSPAWL